MSIHRTGFVLGVVALLAAASGGLTWLAWPSGAPFVAGGIALLGLGLLAGLELLLPSRPRLPRPTGKHRVGRTVRALGGSIIDSAVVFYPALDRTRPAAFLDDAGPVARVLGVPRWLLAHLTRLVVSAQRDASPAPLARPWVLYIHGGMGMPEDQTTLCIELASRGYSVLAPRLTLDLAQLGLSAGATEQEVVRALKQAESDYLPALVDELHRTVLGRLDWPTGPLTCPRGVIAVGHSLGGGLAGALAARLQGEGYEVAGWVNLDGQVLPWTPDTPQLHLSQGMRFTPGDTGSPLAMDYERRIRRACRATRQRCEWFRFPRAGHASFTDLPYLLRPVGPMEVLVGRDRSVPAQMRRLVREFIEAPLEPSKPPPTAEVIDTA